MSELSRLRGSEGYKARDDDMAGITFTEGSGLQDSIFGKSQDPIRMLMEERGEAWEQQSMLKELFNMETSDKYGEKMTTMTAMEGFQAVGENGTYPMDSMQEGFSKFIEHMTWKDKFAMSEEIVEDSTNIDLKRRPAKFIAGFYRTREKFGAALFANAINGSTSFRFNGKDFGTLGADKKNLFATDHPSALARNKKVQSNQFSDAFSNDALGAMETAMQGFTGDNDEILDVAPDTILIPNDYQLKKAVFEAIGADKDPTTSNNGFNYQYGRWSVIVWPYLNMYLTAGLKPWVLLDSRYNEEYGGAMWYDRKPLTVHSEIDPGNDANVWKGRARWGAGFNDWRFAAVGGITGGTKLIGT